MTKEVSTPQNNLHNLAAVIHESPASVTPVTTFKHHCCFPGFLFRRKGGGKQVRFDTAGRGKSGGGPGGSTFKRTKTSKHGSSPSKRSFYSALSRFTERQSMLSSSPSTQAESQEFTAIAGGSACCPCGFSAHAKFDPAMPLIIPPNVEPGSQEELRIHADAILGRWITIVERSDSLDPQMIHVGIGKMKRMIMNRLGAIPLGAELVEDGKTLKVWIETPVGNKATHASLVGAETFDADSDLGDWTAKTCITDYSSPVFCQGREVRALQMERQNPKFGTAYETKVVLPDAEFGKILLYNITIHPLNNGTPISVNRIYRPEEK